MMLTLVGIATRKLWHKTSLPKTYLSLVRYNCLIAAGILTVEEAEGRIDVGDAFQRILAGRGDTLDIDDYHRLDTLVVESMFLAGDPMTVGDIAAAGLGVGTKVQSLQMQYSAFLYLCTAE